MFFKDFIKENFDEKFKIFKQKNIKNYDKKYHTNYVSIKEFENNLNVQLESLIKGGFKRQVQQYKNQT